MTSCSDIGYRSSILLRYIFPSDRTAHVSPVLDAVGREILDLPDATRSSMDVVVDSSSCAVYCTDSETLERISSESAFRRGARRTSQSETSVPSQSQLSPSR